MHLSAAKVWGETSGTVRILAIDDDPQARALLDIALAEAQFRPVLDIATTARIGLERIRADEHDVYLVDQQLPDGTGVELIHAAKEGGTSKPFILITGHGSGDLDQAALREGAADYVEKHLVASQLERSIRYALRNWQASRVVREREEQLRQSQKMEAIGRLAGGVAHDFNNLLTAIIGYTDLLADYVGEGGKGARELGEIRKAADRAAALTRQLLAFSRKQFLSPEVICVNEIVSGMLPMVPGVMGDNIETTTEFADDLHYVEADPGQLEQVLVHLVLNARDAMPLGGHLTIATSNVTLDAGRIAAERVVLDPGPYVMLSVVDTGTGMDAETRARAFEPFFTTKAEGKGSGLGLATVYGIIDQSGGAIAIDSAPGRGTAIRIYLPVTSAPAATSRATAAPAVNVAGGTETLLVVEDNDAVRDLAVQSLRKRGYTVHEARNADEAIDWTLNSRVKPALLVTDVVMPGLSGPNLAARLMQEHPKLRVLYMSGYAEEATAAHGAFWGGVPLLQKPFTPGQLAQRVRMALDSSAGRA